MGALDSQTAIAAQSAMVARQGAKEKADCIVAIKPCCNRIVFAAVNEPRVMNAEAGRDLAKLVASGCSVEHWTATAVRAGNWGCTCK